MGVAKLSRVTVLAPRSDYQAVLKLLSKFEDFHLVQNRADRMDPMTEELAVRAVKLYAQVDQIVRDLSILLVPPTMDVVFRGARIEQTQYDANSLKDLLGKAEKEIEPAISEIRAETNRLSQLVKDEQDTQGIVGALKAISGFSTDLSNVASLKRLKLILAISETKVVPELRESLSDLIFASQPVSNTQSVILIAGTAGDASRIDRAMRALEVKPFILPEGVPQNPAEAYKKLSEELTKVTDERVDSEARITELKTAYGEKLLAVRELTESAHNMLDQVRKSGSLKRLVTTSGFIPRWKEVEFLREFGNWIVYSEHVSKTHGHSEDHIPTLLSSSSLTKPFIKITENQGYPGGHEVDPTPFITLVFPIFFGMMFGDLGHGLVVTAFALLLRTRQDENIKQWGNIFLAAGLSACVFGLLFGEIFGFDLGQLAPIPKALEIVKHVGNSGTLNQTSVIAILVISILIGIAHITTGMVLDIVQAVRGGERFELITEKIPHLIMYLSGIGFGLAFIQAGYTFNVFGTPQGAVSTIIVLIMAIEVALWKGVATIAGKIHEDSVPMAFVGGLIELLVKISEFLSNTISYARLGILLLVHSALLIAVNLLLTQQLYVAVPMMVFFNILIILLEGLIVYIQDLRLHVYEFFTKFYEGTGIPFRKIFPTRTRIRINWH